MQFFKLQPQIILFSYKIILSNTSSFSSTSSHFHFLVTEMERQEVYTPNQERTKESQTNPDSEKI